MRPTIFTLALLAATGLAAAQSGTAGMSPASGTANPSTEVMRSYNGVKAHILASADLMPADDFSYKFKPDVRTFARVLNHVSEAQLHTCGAINGTPKDALAKVPAETASKAEIVADLKASFAECDKAYATLTASNVLDPISMGRGTRTRIGALWGNVSHDNEQYAALAIYLRLKDIAPPSSEK